MRAKPIDGPISKSLPGKPGFVICGIEHSGTTLISDLFRQIPHVDSGFETGVLLSASPPAFLTEMPFAEHILGGWAITREELESCCDTESFSEFYARLGAASRSIKPDCTTLFDKTPRYLAQLACCLQRTDAPFVVTYKDPRSIVFSDFRRSGETRFDAWFDGYVQPKLGYMRHLYASFKDVAVTSERVFCVSLEKLCRQPQGTCEAMFAHCGQNFRSEYLDLKDLRYHHTRSNSVSTDIPFEYLEGLTVAQINKISSHFEEFEDWFCE